MSAHRIAEVLAAFPDRAVHDFCRDNLGWGWNILYSKSLDGTTLKEGARFSMLAIGPGVKPGDMLLTTIKCSDGARVNVLNEVTEIEYDTNPPDMFKATLRYTGYQLEC